MIESTPTSTIINMTIEEEQRRRTRALHVRIMILKDRDNIGEEIKDLYAHMGIIEPTHTGAWRVGKKGEKNKEDGSSKERELILRFPSLEARKEFLKNMGDTQENMNFSWEMTSHYSKLPI